ncbi:MAG: hypothetical protein MUC88_20380, partial [Planctomycetes bacterium]|nr:hypothetical protein [Planctomycetota bacterium]
GAPANVLVALRKKTGSSQIVLHVLNRDYDAQAKRLKPLSNVEVTMDRSLVAPTKSQARLLSYDQAPQQVDLLRQEGTVRVRVPELRLWTLIVLE